MFKPFANRLLFLSLFFLATSIVSAVVTLTRIDRAAVGERVCAELVAHSHEERSLPPIWSRVAIEAPTSWAQLGADLPKYLLRQHLAHHWGRLRPQVEESLVARSLLSESRGPRSSDYYVVAYRKIVI